jgi:hypothetical protein
VDKAKGIDSVIKVAQTIITVLLVIGSLGLTIITPWLFYRNGLNEDIFSAVCGLWIPFLWMHIFFLLLLQSALVIVTICKYSLRHSGRSFSLLGVCIITICACWLWFFLISKPGLISFSEGFRDRIKREVDVGEIQKWLQTIEIPKGTVNYIIDPYGPPDPKILDPEAIYIKSLDSLNWPEAIRVLNPEEVYIRPYGNEGATIRLLWGGPFGKWGIVVGPTDMEVPKSDMRRRGEYRLKLAPGAYVWHDIR